MAGLTGLFRRGTTYYMRVVLPLDHRLRAERPTGRIVISLGSSNYREALSKGYAKRAEILAGTIYETVPTASSLAPRIHNLVCAGRRQDIHPKVHPVPACEPSICLRSFLGR